ncbi:hypothetical protein MNB_SUP05-5-843 [hydrothermal vent metagenome]|uniref:Peptidase C80 domain-containing protein n=1 Tax=hydrothermal vent metagenome TaxID=652676 RepID=A0A1W1BE56_9ZZZZ
MRACTGRCLALSKLFLIASKNNDINGFVDRFQNLETITTDDLNDIRDGLKEFHVAKMPKVVTYNSLSISDSIDLLDKKDSDQSFLLNTTNHSMAISRVGGKYYFFDPNSVIAEFNTSKDLKKAVEKYLDSDYGSTIEIKDKKINTVVGIDVDSLEDEDIHITHGSLKAKDFIKGKKYNTRLVIQKGDDEVSERVTNDLKNKLNKKYGEENVVVVKQKKDGSEQSIQGERDNLQGKVKVQVVGHGVDEDGVRKLEGQDGKQIADSVVKLVKPNAAVANPAKLEKVSLISCDGDKCGAKGRSLAEDVKQSLQDKSSDTEVKGYKGRVDVDSNGKRKRNVPEGEGLYTKVKKARILVNKQKVDTQKLLFLNKNKWGPKLLHTPKLKY